MNSLVFPGVEKYPEETWEWTIGRDFKDRLAGEGRVERSSNDRISIQLQFYIYVHTYTFVDILTTLLLKKIIIHSSTCMSTSMTIPFLTISFTCADTASYFLERAITTAGTDCQPLIDAVYW
jgi:hypothetical protein